MLVGRISGDSRKSLSVELSADLLTEFEHQRQQPECVAGRSDPCVLRPAGQQHHHDPRAERHGSGTRR